MVLDSFGWSETIGYEEVGLTGPLVYLLPVDWLSFASSLVWPGVVILALLLFRKNLNTWMSQRPSEVKAGPFQVKWNEELKKLDEAVPDFSPADDAEPQPDTEAESSPEPEATGGAPESLSLRLRNVARESPVGAISDAWMVVESEIRQSLLENGLLDDPRTLRASTARLLDIAMDRGVLPGWLRPTLNTMRQLRNLAVHAVEPVGPAEAFEFLGMADLVLGELRSRAA